MKTKLSIAFLVLFFHFNSKAQTDIGKGSVILGGDISFSSYKLTENNTDTRKNSLFNISPAAGFAVKKNLFVGANLEYSLFNNEAISNASKIRGNGFNYGVFVRQYKPLKHNFYIFLQGGVGGRNYHEKLKNAQPGEIYDSKQFAVNASLSPGISYAITSKLQIETGLNNIVSIGYSETKTEDNLNFVGVRKEASLNASTSLNNFSSVFYLGFRILLQKKSGV